jgi:hypothetical protein
VMVVGLVLHDGEMLGRTVVCEAEDQSKGGGEVLPAILGVLVGQRRVRTPCRRRRAVPGQGGFMSKYCAVGRLVE